MLQLRSFSGQADCWLQRLFRGQNSSAPDCARPVPYILHLILVLASSALFLTRLSCPLLEPDETRYAEIPRQMLAQRQFVEPVWHGQPYYHKPPLLYWLVMASYSIFGVHDWAARLIPALCSLGTVLATSWWGRQIGGPRTGLVSALILTLSGRFVYLGRMVTMDVLLALCVTCSLAAAHQALRHGQLHKGWWAASALATGLGLLSKGPVTLVLVMLPLLAWHFLDRRTARLSCRNCVAYIALAAGVAAPWYVAMFCHNPQAAGDFFWLHHFQRYLDPIDHEEPVWFFLPGLLLGTLPWSLLLVPFCLWLAQRSPGASKQPPAALIFIVLALVVCVGFFSLSGCKRVGYILPALPPLALCLGIFVTHSGRSRVPPRLWQGCAAVMFVVLLIGVEFWLPAYHRRFALRGQVRRHVDEAAQTAVFCYPKRWDSVTFYLQRDDVRVYTAAQRQQLVTEILATPDALIFVKTRFKQELVDALPPGYAFVERGRQGTTLTVGQVQPRMACSGALASPADLPPNAWEPALCRVPGSAPPTAKASRRAAASPPPP